MAELNFTDLRSNIGNILGACDEQAIIAIEKRILQEIDQIENNPEQHLEQLKIKEKIRHIENKALEKLGKAKNRKQPTQGTKCSLCAVTESDIDQLIRLSNTHNICNACVCLVNQVVEENGA